MTKSKSTCSLGTSTVSASAQQNTAQWDKFVDFNIRCLNGFPKNVKFLAIFWKIERRQFELTFAIIPKNWKVNQANDGLSLLIDELVE